MATAALVSWAAVRVRQPGCSGTSSRQHGRRPRALLGACKLGRGLEEVGGDRARHALGIIAELGRKVAVDIQGGEPVDQ